MRTDIRLDKLSDDQLITLFKSAEIEEHLKSQIIQEIDKRDMNFERKTVFVDFPKETKTRIRLMAPIIALRPHKCQKWFIDDWTKLKYKAFWRQVNKGLLMYSFLIIVSMIIIKLCGF